MKSVRALQSFLSVCLLFAAGPSSASSAGADLCPVFSSGADPHDIGQLSPAPTACSQEGAQGKAATLNDGGDAILEQVRRNVLDLASQLPDFVVNQEETRYSGYPTRWFQQDTLDLEVTYESVKGERSKLLKHNGRPTDEDYAHLGGSLAFGVFSKSLATLFHPATKAEFKTAKQKSFRGRDALVYEFSVPQTTSRLTVGVNGSGKSIFATYAGVLWVDPATQQVLKIEQSSPDATTSIPVALNNLTVEYDWVSVGGDKLMLPVQAEIVLSHRWGAMIGYTRSVMTFSDYRKFGGEIKLEATPPPKI